MNLQDAVVSAGDDVTLPLTARDRNNAVQDLTGGTIAWRLARDANCAPLLTKTGAIVSASAGTFSIALAGADTQDLYGDYRMDAFLTVAGATTRVMSGSLRVLPVVEAS